jgi:FMN reductase
VTLLNHVAQALAERVPAEIRSIQVSEAAPHLLTALSRDQASPTGEALLRTIETADILIVGSPVYRGSYTGALKHIFDLLDREALVGRPALLAATGGTALHGLVGEHQLRPLLGFFRALTAPTFVFATETEISGAVLSEAVQQRVAQAVDETVALYDASLAIRQPAHRRIVASA